MLLIHLGLPKSGTSSLQKMVSLIDDNICLSSSYEFSEESPKKPTKKNRLVAYIIYRIVNDNDKDFAHLCNYMFPILYDYIDESLKNTKSPLFISQEALSSTWRIDRKKIIDRLEICFSKYSRKYILVEREPKKLIKSLYKMRVRDKSTNLPFQLWIIKHYFSKTKLIDFKNSKTYKDYIRKKIDDSKASLEILDFEHLFNKPYDHLRRFFEILEIKVPFKKIIEKVVHENKSELKDNNYSSKLQNILYKTANFS